MRGWKTRTPKDDAQLTQTIEGLLQQGHDLGVAWAQEMLHKQERAISIGGSLIDRAKAIVSGIIDRVESFINDLLGGTEIDDPEVAIEDAITQALDSIPDMIAATEMQTAIQDAVYTELDAQPGIATIQWMDNPGSCAQCRGYAEMGEVPLGTDFGGNPYPPAHPNCRCHLELIAAGGQA